MCQICEMLKQLPDLATTVGLRPPANDTTVRQVTAQNRQQVQTTGFIAPATPSQDATGNAQSVAGTATSSRTTALNQPITLKHQATITMRSKVAKDLQVGEAIVYYGGNSVYRAATNTYIYAQSLRTTLHHSADTLPLGEGVVAPKGSTLTIYL